AIFEFDLHRRTLAMNVLVCTDMHFIQVGERYYAPGCRASFFQRYTEVWDEVLVLGRLARRDTSPDDLSPLDFRNIRVIGTPEYVGPMQYLKCRRQVKAAVRIAVEQADSILLRGVNAICMQVYCLSRSTGRPYGIEVLGDVYDTFSPGGVQHP